MSPKKKTKDELEEVPSDAAPVAETVEAPAAAPAASLNSTRYSRGVVAAGVAGLLAVGGVAGFAIGRETGDDDGPRFTQIGQNLPGQGPGQGGPQTRRNDLGDQRGRLPQFPDQGSAPDVAPQESGDDVSGI